jgi:DDE superfamily endonuclease
MVIPPDANAAFVATMEDVLEVYQRPHNPQRPLVCLDETSKQLIIDTRAPIPAKPGQPARHDYEYERNGVANLFMVFAPLEGWRHLKVTDRHTAIDCAHVLRDLSDTHFPDCGFLDPRLRFVRGDLYDSSRSTSGVAGRGPRRRRHGAFVPHREVTHRLVYRQQTDMQPVVDTGWPT